MCYRLRYYSFVFKTPIHGFHESERRWKGTTQNTRDKRFIFCMITVCTSSPSSIVIDLDLWNLKYIPYMSQRNISSRFGFLYNGVDFSWAVKLFSGAVSSPHRHNVYIIIIIISSSMLDLDLWKSQVCGTHSSPFALAVLHFRQLEVMLFRIMVWMRREQWSCFPARYQVHTVTVTNTYSQCVSPDWLLLSFSFRPTFPFR